MAPAMRKVAASILSGITLWRVPRRLRTPRMRQMGEPAPSMAPPIALMYCARSWISGSQAALSMVVTPEASDAAIIVFAVPSTVEPKGPPR
jgi:hypothetical protein